MEFTDSEKTFLDILNVFMKDVESPSSVFLSGGFIRDRLSNRTPKDMDIIVAKELYKRLTIFLKKLSFKDKRVIMEKDKPAYGYGYPKNMNMFFLSFENTEIEIRPFTEDLKNDLLTRDFTINALYYDVSEEKLVDLVGVS